MAAIPSSGSLIATHDYYRSECAYFLACVLSSVKLQSFSKVCFKIACFVCRAAWVQLQQQLLWQLRVHRRGHSSPPWWEHLHVAPLALKEFLFNILCSSQDFPDKIPATGGCRSSLQSRTSPACRLDLRIRGRWPKDEHPRSGQQLLTLLCVAGTEPTPWPTVRWPASPGKWFSAGSLKAAKGESSDHQLHQLPPRTLPPTLSLPSRSPSLETTMVMKRAFLHLYRRLCV